MNKSNELLERLYYNLPRSFRNADVDTKHQLKRYLDILVSGGFQPLHEETKGLLTLIDIDKVPAKYLPHLASDLGFAFPYDLDEQTQRTYIKNAVISYRMKGTRKALEFMIRELTKFKVTLDIDENERNLSINLEVDPDRQDIDKMYEKIMFLVEEYAPPFGEAQITNAFVWEELVAEYIRDNFKDELLETFMVSYSAYEPLGFLILNHDRGAVLNSLDYNISNFDQYGSNRVSYEMDTYINQPKEDDLRTEKLDDFGEGTHTVVYPRTRESVYTYKKWDREEEIINIHDKGVTSLIDDTAIVLNRLTYGLNALDQQLTNVNVLDFNDQAYTFPEVDYASFVDRISMKHTDIYTQNFKYSNHLFRITFTHHDLFKHNISYLEDTVQISVYNEIDGTLTKEHMDYIINDFIRVNVEAEEFINQFEDVASVLVAKSLLHADELTRVIKDSGYDVSNVKIITDLKRDYNFILVGTPTGDPNALLLGQIEQLVRNSIADTHNYDIIETGKIGTKYNETKSMRTEEYRGSQDMSDDFTDIIHYVDKE